MFKKNLRRVSVLLLTVVILMSFAACGNDEKKNIEDLSDEEIEEIFEEFEAENFGEENDVSSTDNKISLETLMFSVDFGNCNGYGDIAVHQNWRDVIPYYVTYENLENYLNSVNTMILAEFSNGCNLDDIVEYVPVQEYNRLTNGDTVYLNAQIKEPFATYGITVDGLKQGLNIDFDSTLVYTVSNLPTAGTMVDIFAPIEQYIVYEGANGNVEARLEIPDGFYFENNGYYFTANSNDGDMSVIYNNETVVDYDYTVGINNYADGDKTMISTETIRDSEGYHSLDEILITKGIGLIDTFKEVNVPDMGNYISGVEQLSLDKLEVIKQSMLSELQKYDEGTSYEFRGLYAGNLKPNMVSETNSTFAVFAVYRSPYDDFFGENTELFTIVPVYDIVLKPDGNLEYNMVTIFDKTEVYSEAEVQSYFNDCPYNCTKIG